MKTKFYYQNIIWNSKRNEINFIGAYLGNGRGKRFEVKGLKRNVMNNESLYLCKIQEKLGNHAEETFKLLVLNDFYKKNFKQEDVQLIGKAKNNRFYLDKEFADGMRKVNRMDKIDKVKLGDMGAG